MNKKIKDRLDKWFTQNYEWLYGEIETNICKGMMKEYTGDLVTHMIEFTYGLKGDKITQLLDDDKLGWYLLTGAGMQLRSSTSPFYRTYRKEKSWARENGLPGSHLNIFDKPDEPYDEELWQCFQREMDNLEWYHKALMEKKFLQGWTLKEMYDYYEIPKRHIVKDLNEAINIIRNKCNEC